MKQRNILDEYVNVKRVSDECQTLVTEEWKDRDENKYEEVENEYAYENWLIEYLHKPHQSS